MKRLKTLLAMFFCLAVFAAPASAWLFGPPTETFEGVVNYIQPTNFTMLAANNQLIRVIIPADKKVPTEVQIGVKVKVVAIQGENKLWYLDHFEAISLQPTP